MKAIWYEEPGEAAAVLQYGDLEQPSPGPGEVLVRVHASGVNPSDTKFRSGWMGLKQPYPRTIPHNDGAGMIEAVGEGVPPSRVGERVWIYEAQRGSAWGTAADYVVVPAYKAVPLPESFDFAAGASLGVPAMTAHFSVFSDGAVEDKTILVHGGAGAVGMYAIQLAKWGGARAITTVSNEEKAETAAQCGADLVLNYRQEDIVARVREFVGKRGCDRIVDVALAANMEINAKLVARNGVIATYESGNTPQVTIPFYDLLYKNAALRTVLVYAMSEEAHAAAARDINQAINDGALQAKIAAHYPLSETAQAHDALDSGQLIGKVVVDVA
ncbi:NADPH:quinone reductase [Acaryochloris marina]|uniref:Oxidoreductase, zinc-binding dehydrogenase family n=1 Tax=Acaryochloris marina (strain MBIC 11017) TaxID=329726 RepID=B0C5V0_ACAM1|nr:NADPH:quinone reductase [Acaryochloris marina]ABW29962.1 oxidoreductase, zinc-binding dehydrogenase family [Acaryochloris marina MBIC11017]